MTQTQEQDLMIAVCRECRFIAAKRVDDYEGEVRGSQDDPGLRHHNNTNHACTSAEPTEGSELEEIAEVVAGEGDWSGVPSSEEVFDMIAPEAARSA